MQDLLLILESIQSIYAAPNYNNSHPKGLNKTKNSDPNYTKNVISSFLLQSSPIIPIQSSQHNSVVCSHGMKAQSNFTITAQS